MAADLLAAALAARANAYAPYSRFRVGAAVRTDRGSIFVGANAENAAYPVGTCAEAGAVAAMVAAGERVIVEALVVGDGDDLVTPCGACRQRLREFGAATIQVHVAGLAGVRESFALATLLPFGFGSRSQASAAPVAPVRATIRPDVANQPTKSGSHGGEPPLEEIG